jgi:hypothetical protein
MGDGVAWILTVPEVEDDRRNLQSRQTRKETKSMENEEIRRKKREQLTLINAVYR